MITMAVVLGAAIGAPLRYLTDLAVRRRHDSVFPWGTLIVNVAGSFLLGGIIGARTAFGGPDWWVVALGTGFCGALTTFSTFGFETLGLVEDGAVLLAGVNVVVSVLAGLIACSAGWWATTVLL
jgi:CrcB protein